MLHAKEPLLLNGLECRASVEICNPSLGNGDVSIWVKNSRVTGKTQNKQTNKHTYCDTQKTCDTYTYCRAFGAVTTCFYDVGLSLLGFEHPTFRLRGHRCVRHSRCGTLKNPQCSMPISAMYRLKFEALHRWWWRIYLSEKFPSGTSTLKTKTNKHSNGPSYNWDLWSQLKDCRCQT